MNPPPRIFFKKFRRRLPFAGKIVPAANSIPWRALFIVCVIWRICGTWKFQCPCVYFKSQWRNTSLTMKHWLVVQEQPQNTQKAIAFNDIASADHPERYDCNNPSWLPLYNNPSWLSFATWEDGGHVSSCLRSLTKDTPGSSGSSLDPDKVEKYL